MSKGITYVSVSAIVPNPMNPRRTFDEEALKELSESIKELGVLQPIIVRNAPEQGFELVCGERRWRASKIAECETIPAIIRKLSDEEAMDLAITENLQRRDVAPTEEAKAFQYLHVAGASVADLAVRFGKSVSYIRTRLALNELLPFYLQKLEAGSISMTQALVIARMDPEIQEKMKVHFDPKEQWKYWGNYRSATLFERIRATFLYSQSIDSYDFDKYECMGCYHNSATASLFGENGGHCLNRSCLESKILEHGKSKIRRWMFEYSITKVYSTEEDNELFSELKMQGVEILNTRNVASTIKEDDAIEMVVNDIEVGIFIQGKGVSLCFIPGEEKEEEEEDKTPLRYSPAEIIKNLESALKNFASSRDRAIVSDVNDFVNKIDFAKNGDMKFAQVSTLERQMVLTLLLDDALVRHQKAIAKHAGIDYEGDYMPMEVAWEIAGKAMQGDSESGAGLQGLIYRAAIVQSFAMPRDIDDFNHIKTCEWVDHFRTDSTQLIVPGIVAKHMEVYKGHEAEINAKIAQYKDKE